MRISSRKSQELQELECELEILEFGPSLTNSWRLNSENDSSTRPTFIGESSRETAVRRGVWEHWLEVLYQDMDRPEHHRNPKFCIVALGKIAQVTPCLAHQTTGAAGNSCGQLFSSLVRQCLKHMHLSRCLGAETPEKP